MSRRRRLCIFPRLRAAVAIGALLAQGSCGVDPHEPRGPSIVLVVVDTLRADHLSMYGAEPGTSPRIALLGRQGVVFRRALAVAPWTSPSVASIVTGLYPDELGMRDIVDPLPPEADTLAERLTRHGYATALIVSNGIAGPSYGHTQGYEFTHFDHYESGPDGDGGLPSFTANRVTEHAIEWAAGTDPQQPFFLHVHYTDPHEPYLPPEAWKPTIPAPEFDEALLLEVAFARTQLSSEELAAVRRHYAGEIAFVDHEIGRLLDALPADTWVILTSDHGEEFGEHGKFLHGHSLYRELLHVPLIIRGPTVAAGSRSKRFVSHVDIAPTILELAGLPGDASLSGQSLVDELDGSSQEGRDRVIFSMVDDELERWCTAAQRGTWKLIQCRDTAALFNLASDPIEQHDVSTRYPKHLAALQAAIEGRKAHRPPRPSLSDKNDKYDRPDDGLREERIRALRAMGYVE